MKPWGAFETHSIRLTTRLALSIQRPVGWATVYPMRVSIGGKDLESTHCTPHHKWVNENQRIRVKSRYTGESPSRMVAKHAGGFGWHLARGRSTRNSDTILRQLVGLTPSSVCKILVLSTMAETVPSGDPGKEAFLVRKNGIARTSSINAG